MPILALVAGLGILAYALSSKKSGGTGTPLPPVLPGQAPGTSFGPAPSQQASPSPGLFLSTSAVQQAPSSNLFARLGGLHLMSFGGNAVQQPSGHDVAPIPVSPQAPAPTPVPVQVPGVQHAMVTTHDTGSTGNLNVRSSPGGAVVGDAPHGSVVEVHGPAVSAAGLDWLPITLTNSGLSGWGAAEYLTLI